MDERAFEEFYDLEYARLVSAVGFIVGDPHGARDAVDEALARAWEWSKRGRTIDCLAAWVRVVALNVARGHLRRLAAEQRARERLARAPIMTDDDPATSRAIDVRRALASLPRRQREVAVLYYFLDLDVTETARELGVTPGTVKTSLHRARAALAAVLAESTEPTDEVIRETA